MPVSPGDVRSKADTVTGAVENPRAAAQAEVEGAVSAQQREAEVKVGISGASSTGDNTKK